MERKRDFSWLTNWRVLTLCGSCLFAGFLLGMLIFGSPWHLPPAWGDIPTWITAIATIGLLAGVIVTAMYAIRAFGQQAEEVGILIEDSKRQADERRRAQATQVFIRIEKPLATSAETSVVNASSYPIYGAQFRQFDPSGLADPVNLGTIMPSERSQPQMVDSAALRTFLTFRDAGGISWIRGPEGVLREQFRATPSESITAIAGINEEGYVMMLDGSATFRDKIIS